MVKYTRDLRKITLDKILDLRKNYFKQRLNDLYSTLESMANQAYSKGTLGDASNFEHFLTGLEEKVYSGKQPTAKQDEESEKQPKYKTRKSSRRGLKPLLTYPRFETARDKGLSEEKIKENYRDPNANFGRFKGAYKQYKRSKK